MKSERVIQQLLLDAGKNGIHAQGSGVVTEPRMYQLISRPRLLTNRKFEIEFLDPGVNVFSFAFE